LLNLVRPARTTLRFLLQTAVTFWWTTGSGEPRQGEGRSRDLSEHGAFVFASSSCCPPAGARLTLKIDLDGIPEEIGRLPVEVEGEVLRVEQCIAERGMLTGGFAVQY